MLLVRLVAQGALIRKTDNHVYCFFPVWLIFIPHIVKAQSSHKDKCLTSATNQPHQARPNITWSLMRQLWFAADILRWFWLNEFSSVVPVWPHWGTRQFWSTMVIWTSISNPDDLQNGIPNLFYRLNPINLKYLPISSKFYYYLLLLF